MMSRVLRVLAIASGILCLLPVSAAAQETGVVATQDPVSQGIVALLLVCVFVFLAKEAAHRVLVVIAAVAIMWLVTYLTPYHLVTFEAAKDALDLNVILLLAAMMAIVGVLKSTGVFDWGVSRLMTSTQGRPALAMALIIYVTALVSAFADNVTTVIFITPMALEMSSRMGIRPRALLLPMIMAANIGGTATLIGDPPNIMIGSGAGLSFVQFLADLTVPCAIMMLGLEWMTIRAFPEDMHAAAKPLAVAADAQAQIRNRPLLRWSLAISAGVFVGFMTHSLTGMPASVPAVIGAAMVLVVQDVLYMRTNRPSHEERKHGLLEVIENEIEWPTLTFFAFLFIAVGAAVQTGLIATLASSLSSLIHHTANMMGLGPNGTILLAAMIILWSAGFLSALIDNIPFVAVSIPIVAQLITELAGGDAIVLWWALSLGACLGGNGTVIGASANVTVVGIADRYGERITFGAFSRFAIPVAVFTLLVSTAFVVAHIYLGQRGALYAGLAVLALLIVLRFGTWGRKPAKAPSEAAVVQ